MSTLTVGLLFDVVLGTLAAKRHAASSKLTPETPKMSAGAAVQTKPPVSADGKTSVKKTTEKKDDVKKPAAKKDTTKTDGLLALCFAYNLYY